MKKTLLYPLTAIAIVTLIGSLAFIKITQFKVMAQAKSSIMPDEIVTDAEVISEEWEPTLNSVGSLAPYQGVTVTTESSGIVDKITFEPGSEVKQGDLLVKMDTSVLEAQLQAAEARANLARLSATRSRELFASNSTAKAEVDSVEAQLQQSQAEVSSIKAQIALKEIRAPFAGHLGIRQINIGQYLDRGNPIVSLQSLDPIYVNFTLPQQQMAQISSGMRVRIKVDAMPEHVFEGKVTSMNPDVDSATRNFRIQATLPNSTDVLRPGMFVNVSVVLPKKERVLVIPATAVLYAPYGDQVFVIEDKPDEKSGAPLLVLRQSFVRLGRTQGDFVVVVSGLKAGERIVSTGVFKLRNGMHVQIDNKLAPVFSANPKPGNS
jgi:membrane fusion protein (multidrug efflux system)